MSNNIYISFSADRSSNDAWVSEVLNSFRITLGKISSIPVNIVSGLDADNDTEKQLDQANIIILVFNGFISDNFAKDLRIIEFRHHEYNNAGKDIFLVVKSGKFSSIIPGYLRKYNQYNFFELNIRTNEIIDYTPFLKGDKENKFWSKLTDLAYDAKMYFEARSDIEQDFKKFIVYLAEVSKDQISHREILKREFLLSGYKVLPSKPLPTSYKEYYESAKEIIKTTHFSIHIMGEIYGDSPSGSDYSFPEIQNKVVTELLGQAGRFKDSFYRFVWLPPNLEPYDEKQIQYLKRLKRELTGNSYGEIIQCSIEEFKEMIFQKINQLSGFTPQNSMDDADGKLVLITDNSSKAICQNIENQIKFARKKYDIIDLSQTEDMLSLDMFREKLQTAKGAIVLNLNGNVNWMQGMLGLTIKNLKLGRTNKKSIAAVSSNKHKTAIDFEALKVDFFSLEDSHLIHNVEKFLIQIN